MHTLPQGFRSAPWPIVPQTMNCQIRLNSILVQDHHPLASVQISQDNRRCIVTIDKCGQCAAVMSNSCTRPPVQQCRRSGFELNLPDSSFHAIETGSLGPLVWIQNEKTRADIRNLTLIWNLFASQILLNYSLELKLDLQFVSSLYSNLCIFSRHGVFSSVITQVIWNTLSECVSIHGGYYPYPVQDQQAEFDISCL